ncbi:RNA-guided endonuclease InsQ/TnpB family protein [Methanopyrus kandleri]|uniref:Predicted transposase n=2 Tax=Methanopyrus kandleri TaxID=2320 RepID=Q8TXQ5_METKA|nr:RNA-guided endonuclease TnpB family protein [Methanopyrus kandleri]AAM01820.1 Predicted transposase [Methanopyrus kandleri AV19]HII70173.1 IS200/IS605 family element transposase accessory protein TnpB [Methanopyrus kandleri]
MPLRSDYRYRSITLKIVGPEGYRRDLIFLSDRCTAVYNELNYLRRRFFFKGKLDAVAVSRSELTFRRIYREYGPILGTQTVVAIGEKNTEAWRSYFKQIKEVKSNKRRTICQPPRYWKGPLGREPRFVFLASQIRRFEYDPLEHRGVIEILGLGDVVDNLPNVGFKRGRGRGVRLEFVGWFPWHPNRVKEPKRADKIILNGDDGKEFFGRSEIVYSWADNAHYLTLNMKVNKGESWLVSRLTPNGRVRPIPRTGNNCENAAAVDIGRRIFAAVYFSDGKKPVLVRWGDAWSRWSYWRKIKAPKEQRRLNKNGANFSHRLKQYYVKAHRAIMDAIRHLVSKLVQILLSREVTLLVIEDLKGLRQKLHGELAYWAYKRIIREIKRKCEEYGIEVIEASPAYTSVTCPMCRSKCKRNGGLVICSKCGKTMNADIVRAYNLLTRATDDPPEPELEYLTGSNCTTVLPSNHKPPITPNR